MRKITAAVVGVGYLGRFHAQKYAQAAQCELVGVVDARREAREAVLINEKGIVRLVALCMALPAPGSA